MTLSAGLRRCCKLRQGALAWFAPKCSSWVSACFSQRQVGVKKDVLFSVFSISFSVGNCGYSPESPP